MIIKIKRNVLDVHNYNLSFKLSSVQYITDFYQIKMSVKI